MLALLVVLAVQTPEAAARAESLLAAGALTEARAIAERLVARAPRNAAAHELLGRVWLAWPVFGRYHALQEFRTAARLAPHDPRPLYGAVQVGFHLGSDEGEVIARDALLKILAIDPDYRDSWERFTQLFRNDAIARRADAALARHPHHGHALQWRAELAVTLREPARADSLARESLRRQGDRVPAYLVRSEAAFLDGREADGQTWHDSAVAYAAFDTTEVLWSRAALIASPEEAARYVITVPVERRSYFEKFWAQRDPNLFTPLNERLGEHTRRLAEARHQFRLLHPFRQVYRSKPARALQWFEQRRWLVDLAANTPGAVRDGFPDLDFLALQDVSATRAAAAGLDARGLTYMRYGPPDSRLPCSLDPRYAIDVPACTSGLDVEGWLYHTPVGTLSLGFVGAEYFQPASVEQVRHAEYVLRTDASTVPAPATVRAWTAFFQSAEGDATDTYARVAADSAAFALWSADGAERGRASGRGILGLHVDPGRYRFGVDIDSAGVLGRLRDVLMVPAFSTGSLEVSSLLLAADSSAADRLATLAGMPADLAYASEVPLAAYAEVYGLTAVGNDVRYVARYTFAPVRSLIGRLTRGTDPVSFEFERRTARSGAVAERLTLDPGSVAPGRYRVTLSVTDLATNVKSETVALVVTLR